MISGDTLKATRNRLSETQAAFAARFGVDQSTIARWELRGPPIRGPVRMTIERVLEELTPEAAE